MRTLTARSLPYRTRRYGKRDCHYCGITRATNSYHDKDYYCPACKPLARNLGWTP